jgi:UDP:flavonoid glycosyltransferase YjiC (YdhE family)
MTNNPREKNTIAYFISPHGYGHAARSAAVMEELPSYRFEIFTLVPNWFFSLSLSKDFGYHHLLTDIGIIQETPLTENIPETVKRLDSFLPLNRDQIKGLSGVIRKLRCRLVVTDISPLGIAVAREAGVPSVLVENFTWDWIYPGYADLDTELIRHTDYLKKCYRSVDYHVQTEPVCRYSPSANLVTPPVSRRARMDSDEVRGELGVPADVKVITLSMGGIPHAFWNYEILEHHRELCFIIPASGGERQSRNNLILVPHDYEISHPDLVNASDAVVGKLGYSTLAEVYHAGVPFGYFARPRFRESGPLEEFCRGKMNCIDMKYTESDQLRWPDKVFQLAGYPKVRRDEINGATVVARFIMKLLQ